MSVRLNNESCFDVLSDVLETLRFRGSVFFRSELAAPWGLSLPADKTPRFHIVFSGECFVGTQESGTVAMTSPGIVMLPCGAEHWIADQPGRELVASARATDACELGNPLFQRGEITHRLMCGLVHVDRHSPHPFLSSLPQLMHFVEFDESQPVWATVSLIEAEIARTGRHTGSIIDRLTEVFFLQLLDVYSRKNKQSVGFLGALSDRRVHRVLK